MAAEMLMEKPFGWAPGRPADAFLVGLAVDRLRRAGRRVRRSPGGRWHVGLALCTNRQMIAASWRAASEGQLL